MKKILLSLVAVFACLSISATTVTKTTTQLVTELGWEISAGSVIKTLATSFKLDPVITISTNGGPNSGSVWGTDESDWRLYQTQKADLVVTPATGYVIKSVNFVYKNSNNGTLKDASGNVVASAADYAVDNADKYGITFTVANTGTKTNGQVRVTSFSVTYEEETGTTIQTPTINPSTGTYTEAQTVTITGPAGYGLVYTTDGTAPVFGGQTSTYTESNTATFKVESTTTVKAIAVDNDDQDICSGVATSMITINLPASSMTVAQAHAAGEGTNIKLENVAVVATASTGLVVGDETGVLYVYKSNHGLAVGDVVTVEGTLSSYGGFAQLPATATITKTGTTTVSYPTPVKLDGAALDAWIASPVQEYAQMQGKLSVSGNYYNITVEGAKTAIGSMVKPNDAIIGKAISGADVTVTGYAMYCTSNKYVYFVATDITTDSEVEKLAPLAYTELKGDFESWTDKTPDQWTSHTTASSASISQSDNAHTGNSSILVKGATSNKRIASTEVSLPAGYYTMTIFANGQAEGSMVRPGYVKVVLNADKTAYSIENSNTDYFYFGAAEVAPKDTWTEIKHTFKVDADIIASILVMNPKNCGDVLVDDVEIRTATQEEQEAYEIATAISNTKVNATATGKFVENGKLVIVKGGKKYNAVGIDM